MSKLVLSAGAQNQSDSTPFNARGGKTGEQMVSQLHGRYYEQVYRGNVFSVIAQGATGVTTSAGLSTTHTGLAIANPAGSGKNLVLLHFMLGQFAAGAAAVVGIMGGAGVLTANLTPQSMLVGSGGVSVARGSAGDTISTPVLLGKYAQLGSLATTGYGLTPGMFIPIDGSIIVPPGSFIASYTSIATTSACNFGFVWEEVAS